MFRNQQKIWCLSLISALYVTPTFSNETKHPPLPSWLSDSFVMTLSAGNSWESAGQAQTLNLSPEITKTYTANKPTHSLAIGDLFLGIQKPLPKNFQIQLGLDFGITDYAKLSGDIWDDADPQFNNYTYQYKIQHQHIALKGKLLADWNMLIMPWISAAIGVGYNEAYNFDNTPSISEAITMPAFASHTVTAFTYTLGIGIERKLSKNWQAGVGYEFSDWGKSHLGAAPGSNSTGLFISHLYTNTLLLNVTYLT